MSIDTKPGQFVRYTNKNGHDHDREKANKLLTEGAIYQVECMDVGGFHSDVKLTNSNLWYNSVMFENVD